LKTTNPFLVQEPNKFSTLDLVDENNDYHKDIHISKAVNKAQSVKLDLVCFMEASKGHNALLKIIDYGKWKYQNDKRKRQSNKTQKHEMKEIRFSPEITDHDVSHKLKHANEFIENGHDLNFTMRLRRRMHREVARLKMQEIVQKCSSFASVTHKKEEGNSLSVKLSKKKESKETKK